MAHHHHHYQFLNCPRVSFQSSLHTMTKEGYYHLLFMGAKHGFFEGEHKYHHKQCLGGYLDTNIIELIMI